MTDHEKALRSVECQVLDRHHLQFPLLQRNTNDAIAALLRCYGDVVRGLRKGSIPKDSDNANHETANEGFRGLAHCLRWIRSNCPHLITVPSPGDGQLQREALELLRWGVKYDPLCNQHIAYSRNVNGTRWVDADVNESGKTITFLPRDDINPQFFVSQVEARKADDERQGALYPDQRLSELSKAWFQSARVAGTQLQFDDRLIESSGALEVAIDWLHKSLLPELSEDSQLGGFSARALRRVLAALHVACLFRVRFEDSSDSMPEGEPHVRTHVLSWKVDDLINWLHAITAVKQSELRSIVELFIFDNEPDRVTSAHKPLILGASDRVFLSPRLFLALPLSQMVVGAANLNPVSKEAYNNVSTQIATAVVNSIAEKIRIGCLTNARNVRERSFQLPDQSTISPDLIVLSTDGTELLVIDVKNAMPPFGVADIVNDLKEWDEKWQPQLNRYVTAFRDHPDILSQHFDGGPFQPSAVFGLILLRWPFPVPARPSSDCGAIDWPTLLQNLAGEADCRTISELYNWILERPDVALVESLQWEQKQVEVGEWTYQYPVLAASSGESH